MIPVAVLKFNERKVAKQALAASVYRDVSGRSEVLVCLARYLMHL